ncbi:MAG TPA: hypothetical protein VJS30_19825 [Paraburkholderia sp.]|nr:hypothetical protein [Paraburkholderia sp.]
MNTHDGTANRIAPSPGIPHLIERDEDEMPERRSRASASVVLNTAHIGINSDGARYRP